MGGKLGFSTDMKSLLCAKERAKHWECGSEQTRPSLKEFAYGVSRGVLSDNWRQMILMMNIQDNFTY